MNFTSTHDISRAINIFSSYDFELYCELAGDLNNGDLEYLKNYQISDNDLKRGTEIYKAYLFVLTFFPGIISIFYGDEVGVKGMGNLYNRVPFPWNKKDKELLKYFKKIGLIRNDLKFLENANLNIYDINPSYLMFERTDKDNDLLITVNRTNDNIKTPVPEKYINSDLLYNIHDDLKENISPYGGLVLKKLKK